MEKGTNLSFEPEYNHSIIFIYPRSFNPAGKPHGGYSISLPTFSPFAFLCLERTNKIPRLIISG
jgi:hypothetical protein